MTVKHGRDGRRGRKRRTAVKHRHAVAVEAIAAERIHLLTKRGDSPLSAEDFAMLRKIASYFEAAGRAAVALREELFPGSRSFTPEESADHQRIVETLFEPT